MSKKIFLKISFILLSVFVFVFALLIFSYLVLIPGLVKSHYVINKINGIVKENLGMELIIKNPNLETALKPKVGFSVDNLTLKKGELVLVELQDFKTSLDFSKIFSKEITLNELLAKKLIIKADDLIDNLPKFEQKETKEQDFDWDIELYKANIKLDETELTFAQKNNTKLDLYARDILLTCEKDYKDIGFNLEAYISKNDKQMINIVSSTVDEIRLLEDEISINNLNVLINNSRLKINSKINEDEITLNAKSDKFLLFDIFEIINSNFIIPNGSELLKPLTEPKGDVAFDVTMNKSGELSGFVDINNTKANIKDLTNLPLNIQDGRILISKEKIDFVDLVGYYGKNKNNTVKIYGDIKDYYKTFNSDINIDTLITNEFFKDYLAPLMNNTVLYVSKPSGTRIIYKAKNNIMNITWLAKINKGVNFGVDSSKSALSDYDRAVKGDFEINKDKLNIKNINYYIASDIKRGIKLKPIVVVDGNMDLSGNIENIGFSFGREMPSEILNIFAGKNFFKKGTIKGNLHVAFKNNIPYLLSDMQLNNTFIPSQRLKIGNAHLMADNNFINVVMDGRFKRANYKFSGKIKNGLKPPFVIKKLALGLDNVDVERFLTIMNAQNTANTTNTTNKEQNIQNINSASEDDEIVDDNYMFDTNLVRIEDCDFTLDKGNYKELTFGNIKAKLTLDDKGILKISSNRFDIAQGISSLRVNCDLVNLKYNVKLGVKDVDSNLMAKVLFNLDKEITGLASGFLNLDTDKSMKLNGDIKFLVNQGTIGKIGLVEYALKIASVFRNPIVMMSPGTIIDIVSIPEGKFDKISGEIKVKDNVLNRINIQSTSKTLSALIRGRFDMERHDTSLRIYTRFSTDKKTAFNLLRNFSLNALANKVQMNTRNDANYYESELVDLPQIEAPEEKTQIFLTTVEGDVEHNNFLSSLKKIK